jgi:hypothetical protein
MNEVSWRTGQSTRPQWQNENPHVNKNQTDDPGRDLAGGPKAAGVGIKRNSDGGSDGGEAEAVGAKRNSQVAGEGQQNQNPQSQC